MSRLDELIQELCPDGVEYKPIGELCSIKARIGWQRLTTQEYLDKGDYYLVTGTDFSSTGMVEFSRCHYVTKDRYEQDANIQLRNEDVLITKDGTLGKVAMVYGLDKPATLNSGVFVVRPLNGVFIPRFLYYLLCSKQLMAFAESKSTGSTIKHLTQQIFVEYQVPTPPLEVQREIVRILDNFTELLAELSVELSARQRQYSYYREKLLTRENAWKHGRIIDMLAQPITDGPHTTPTFVSDGVPFISVDAIWDGKIHFENKRGFITPAFDEECCKKYKPQKHDVYMVKSGSTTGKVAYVDTDDRFNIWSPLAAMRVNANNSSRYLFYLLQTEKVQNQVRAHASHGSQPNLSMRVLEQFEVDIPPLAVQQRIVSILDNFDAICSDLERGLPAEIEARRKQYEYYRDKLLTFKPLA